MVTSQINKRILGSTCGIKSILQLKWSLNNPSSYSEFVLMKIIKQVAVKKERGRGENKRPPNPSNNNNTMKEKSLPGYSSYLIENNHNLNAWLKENKDERHPLHQKYGKEKSVEEEKMVRILLNGSIRAQQRYLKLHQEFHYRVWHKYRHYNVQVFKM